MNPEIPAELSHIVRRCLAKSPDDRFAAVADVVSALDVIIRARNQPPPPGVLTLLRRPVVMGTALLVILAIAAGGWRWRVVTSRVRWAHTIAAPEVQRLFYHGDYGEAFLLARQALAADPDDPHLQQLWVDVSVPAVMTTDPAGADVVVAGYRTPSAWFSLGRTPINDVRIPRGLIRMRLSKPGFQPIEATLSPPLQRFRLDPVDAVPPGMVRVLAGRDAVRFGKVGDLEDFWIDRFEVTNRQFKEFVDHGGYTRREYWREPFVEGGRSVPWEEALEDFATPQDARSRDMAVRDVSRGPGGVSCRRGELVRSGGVRGVCRQEPPHDVSLVPCGESGALRRHPHGQQLHRKGAGSRRQLQRAGSVRHLRYGGQCEGMVLERNDRPSVPARRRMVRAAVQLCGLRCERGSSGPPTDSGVRNIQRYLRPSPHRSC